MRISDWSSDVCSSDLAHRKDHQHNHRRHHHQRHVKHVEIVVEARQAVDHHKHHQIHDDAADDRLQCEAAIGWFHTFSTRLLSPHKTRTRVSPPCRDTRFLHSLLPYHPISPCPRPCPPIRSD